MADQTQTAIFELKIDAGKAEQRIAELTTDLTAAKKANDDLEKSFKAGNITAEEYGKQSASNKRTLKELGAELGAETRLLDLHTKQTKEATGSNNQMRAQLSFLTQQYNALSKEERENVEVGGLMKNNIKELSDALKENESAVGDNRRNVGNYTGGILQAVDGTGLLAQVTTFAQGAQEAYTATLNITKASLAGNVTGLKLLRLALMATGIGAVVVLLGGLVSFLTRTQEGMDFVAAKTKGFTTAITFLMDKLSGVGKMLFDAFDNPKQALNDLVKFIETNLMNRLKSFAVIWEGIQKKDLRQINNGLFQMSTGVEDVIGKTANLGKELAAAAKAGESLERLQQRIERDRINNLATNKQMLGDAERLKNVRDNEFNSIEKRQKANEQGFAVEKKRLEILAGLGQRQVDVIQKEINMRGGIAKATNEQLERLREAENEVADIREDAYGKQNEFITERFTLEQDRLTKLKDAEKARLDAAAERLDRANRDTIARMDAEIAKYAETSAKRLELDQRRIDKQRDIELQDTKLTEGEKLKITAEAEAAKRKLREDFQKAAAERIKELTDKEYQESLTNLGNYFTEQEALLAANQAAEIAAVTGSAEERELKLKEIQEFYAAVFSEIELSRLQAQKVAQEDYGQSTIETNAAINNALVQQELDAQSKLTEAERKGAADRKAAREGEYVAAAAISDSLMALSDVVGEKSSEFAAFAKMAALFQIGVQTAQAIAALTASSTQVAASIAAASGPAGIVTGPAAYATYYATNIATILASIAQAKDILSDEAPKYKAAKGGVLRGPSHKQGGIRGTGRFNNIEVEGNEAVLTAGVTKNPVLFSLASLINQLGGGVPLMPTKYGALGGIVLPKVEGSLTMEQALQPARVVPSTQPVMDYKQLASEIAKIQVVTRVSDIAAGLGNRQRTINRTQMK